MTLRWKAMVRSAADSVIYARFAAYLHRHYGVRVSREAFDRVYGPGPADGPGWTALRRLIVRRALEETEEFGRTAVGHGTGAANPSTTDCPRRFSENPTF